MRYTATGQDGRHAVLPDLEAASRWASAYLRERMADGDSLETFVQNPDMGDVAPEHYWVHVMNDRHEFRDACVHLEPCPPTGTQ